MIRRPTTLVLASRALTALITIGCLGCSAFDPLMDSLFGSGVAGMDCAAEMSAAPSSTADGHDAMSVSDQVDSRAGDSCDCGSCQSASPQAYSFALAKPAAPRPERETVAELLSVTRAPLAPPPESRTL